MAIPPNDVEGFFEAHTRVNGVGDPHASSDPLQRDAVKIAREATWASLVTPVDPAWIVTPPPPRLWLLRDQRTPNCAGVFPLGKAGELIAESGGSKTMVTIQLAIAIATATPWLDMFSVASPGRVLLLLAEEDREEVQRRIHSAARRLRVDLPHDSIVTLPLSGHPCALLERGERGNSVETDFMRWLRDEVAASSWKLIVFDPLSRFAGPDAEKDNAQGTRFVQAIESFARPSETSVLATHHTNQPSRAAGVRLDGTSGRGSTSLVDGFRWSVGLKVHIADLDGQETSLHLRKTIEFTHIKSNYSLEFEPLMLRRDADNGGVLVPLDGADVAMLREANHGASPRGARAAAKNSEQAAKEVIEDRAVVRIVGETPGIPLGALRIAIKAAVGCGSDRADVAIERVRKFLDVIDGKQGAKLRHLPAVSRLPENLRTEPDGVAK